MSWIPPHFLPKWLLFVSVMAIYSAAQSFADHSLYRRIMYKRNPTMVTPLMSRMFGVWNLLSAAVRLTCAYDMSNKSVYHLTMFTFALALAHFWSEVFIYKSAALNSPGIISTSIVASTSTVLMIAQYSYYMS